MDRVSTVGQADLSRITVVTGQRSGQPCIRGFRVTVWDVLNMLASGMCQDEILPDHVPGEGRLWRSVRLRFAGRAGSPFALKLLLDANLSPKLVGRLAELFPDSAHVLLYATSQRRCFLAEQFASTVS